MGRTLADALKLMRGAYSRQPFGDLAVQVYAQQLADLGDEDVYDAVERLVKTSVHMPTIADIRHEVAETRLGLPTAEEAWDAALNGGSDNPVVAAAIKACGGRWSIQHADNLTVVAAQFRKQYEGRRASAVRAAAAGDPIRPEQLKRPKVERIHQRTVAALPETTRVRPRPIMTRLMWRYAGREVPPITEEDIADAMVLLREGPQVGEDPLYAEAERVMEIASDR